MINTNKEISEKLREIICDYLGDNEIEVNENSALIEDLGLSSLDLISVVGSVEDSLVLRFLMKMFQA